MQVVGSAKVEAIIDRPVQAFEIALDIGTMGIMFYPRRLDWPSLTDPSDGWVLDLAWEANADYIVTHDRRLSEVAAGLGFEVITAEDLLHVLQEA